MCQDGVLGDWVLLLRLTQCPVPRAASEVARGAAGPAQSPLWGMLQEGGGAGLQRGSSGSGEQSVCPAGWEQIRVKCVCVRFLPLLLGFAVKSNYSNLLQVLWRSYGK